jgi:hypothetical protein
MSQPRGSSAGTLSAPVSANSRTSMWFRNVISTRSPTRACNVGPGRGAVASAGGHVTLPAASRASKYRNARSAGGTNAPASPMIHFLARVRRTPLSLPPSLRIGSSGISRLGSSLPGCATARGRKPGRLQPTNAEAIARNDRRVVPGRTSRERPRLASVCGGSSAPHGSSRPSTNAVSHLKIKSVKKTQTTPPISIVPVSSGCRKQE